MTGFEPATSWSQTRRSSQAELHPARTESLGGDEQTVNVDVSRETKFGRIMRLAAISPQFARSHRLTRNR